MPSYKLRIRNDSMPAVRNGAQAGQKSAAPAELCRQKNAAHINARRRSNKLRTLEA